MFLVNQYVWIGEHASLSLRTTRTEPPSMSVADFVPPTLDISTKRAAMGLRIFQRLRRVLSTRSALL
jgi:hypothetical protein